MENRKVIAVMACDPSGIIGADGKIPWRFESEVRHFLNTVSGGILIMGRKTFESLPRSVRDKHKCIVFSKDAQTYRSEDNTTFVSSLDEFKGLNIPQQSKLFMIGGAETAHLFLKSNLIYEFILTVMHKEYRGDAKLDLSLLNNWTKELISTCDDYSIYRYICLTKN